MTLKRQAIRGAMWTGGGSAIATVVHFGQWAILARLLVPDDFGLMAMSLVVIGLAEAFTDLGVSGAIIQRRQPTRQELSSLYWLNVFAGVAVFLVVAALSPVAAAFYGEPVVGDLLLVASVAFVMAPLGQQFRVLLQKELAFKRIARIELWGVIVGAAFAIAAAALGAGVFALVLGRLVNTAVRTALFVISGWSRWRPWLRFRAGDLRGYLSFGLFQVGERCVNALAANIDYLIVGRLLGAEALGYYMLAYQLAIMPLLRLNPVLTRVAFPVFALKQDDAGALRWGYCEVGRLLATVLCPALIGLAAIAPLALPMVFGARWEASAGLVQMLCVVGLLKSLMNPAGSVLLAKGRADIGFAWNLLVLALNSAAFLFAATRGVDAVATAYAGLMLGYFIAFHVVVLRPVIGLRLTSYLASLGRPIAMAIVMGAIVYPLVAGAGGPAFQTLPGLLFAIVTGVVIYTAELVFFDPEHFVSVLRQLGMQPVEA